MEQNHKKRRLKSDSPPDLKMTPRYINGKRRRLKPTPAEENHDIVKQELEQISEVNSHAEEENSYEQNRGIEVENSPSARLRQL